MLELVEIEGQTRASHIATDFNVLRAVFLTGNLNLLMLQKLGHMYEDVFHTHTGIFLHTSTRPLKVI